MSETTNHDVQESSWVSGIYAITLFVEDLEAAKEFYCRAFGMSAIFEEGNSAVFQFGSTLINLLRITQADELVNPGKVASHDAGVRHVFTISVDDVDAMCAELKQRGVELLNGPMDRWWGIRTASFADPAGHIWEIAK